MELAVTTSVSVVNPDLGDLALTDEGTEIVRSELHDEVHQRLLVRLHFFKGEWFLDLDEGCPYYEHILVKAPSDRTIRLVFTSVLTQTVGVRSLTSFAYSIDKATRTLTLTFKLLLEDGSTFSSTNYPPYRIVV